MQNTTLFNLGKAGVVVCALFCFANSSAQSSVCEIRHVRVLESDDFFDAVNLDGIVFPPRANSILILNQPISGAGTLLIVPPGGIPGGPDTVVEEVSDPINITYDSRANRMFIFEGASSELIVINLGGRLRSPNAIQRFAAFEYGVDDANGIAVDPKTGTLFLLDRFGPEIVEVIPTPNRKDYDGATALAEGRISVRPIQRSRGPLRGLGFNFSNGGLYVFSPGRQELSSVAEDGTIVPVGDLSGTGHIDPQGFVFVRSLDQTDDANRMNLYVATDSGPSGQVTEWSLDPCD